MHIWNLPSLCSSILLSDINQVQLQMGVRIKRDLEQITDVEGMVIISKNSKYGFVLAIYIYKLQMPYAVSFQFCDLKQDVFTGSTNHKDSS